jgi:hypothetical protein
MLGSSVLAGMLLVGGGALAHNGTGTVLAAAKGQGSFGQRGGFGWGGRGGGALTVTGVTGDTIIAATTKGQTVTITVTSTRKYGEAGQSVTLAAI